MSWEEVRSAKLAERLSQRLLTQVATARKATGLQRSVEEDNSQVRS